MLLIDACSCDELSLKGVLEMCFAGSGGSRRKLLGYIYKGGTRTPCCYYH